MPQVIQLNTPFIYILGLAAIASALTYWQYRQTVPKISAVRRYILMCLRFIALFLLLFILLKPIINLKFQKEHIPKTEIFIDQSLSMATTDSASSPEFQINAIVNKLKIINNAEFFTFSSRVEQLDPDIVINYNGLTNFDRVFSTLNNSESEQALIISDGYVTEGGYPQQMEAGRELKLFILGTGQKQIQQDIFIDQVDFEPLAYLNENQLVRATIGSRLLKEKTAIDIQLKVQGKVISNKKAVLDSTNAFQNIEFNYTPRKLGLTKIIVSIQTSASDTEDLNNTRSFTATVLKKKLNVAIFSATADYDGKFIYQILKREQDIDCRYYIERPDGTFGPGINPKLEDDPDILILQNYPGMGTPTRNLSYIENLISNRKSSLLFLTSKKTRMDKLQALDPFLPFTTPSITGEEIETANYIAEPNPLLDLFGLNQINQIFWKNIPPISNFKNELPLKSDAIPLIHSSNRPIMVQFSKTGFRNITLIGQGFWRWHFLLQNKPDLISGYGQLLKNSLRWLADKEELKQVQLRTTSEKAIPGQTIKLDGFLYDATFKPIKNGQMQIKIKTTLDENHILAQTDSSGAYWLEYTPTSEGRIMFIAEGIRDQLSLGSDTLEVEVLPLEKEFLYSGINEAYLKNIAENHGGRYFQLVQIDSLIQVLKPSAQTITVQKQIDLWFHISIFLIIGVSILTEWVLRKRFGLI